MLVTVNKSVSFKKDNCRASFKQSIISTVISKLKMFSAMKDLSFTTKLKNSALTFHNDFVSFCFLFLGIAFKYLAFILVLYSQTRQVYFEASTSASEYI